MALWSSAVQVMGTLLERRAKLGSVSRRQIPAPEALARHRVLSVASAPGNDVGEAYTGR